MPWSAITSSRTSGGSDSRSCSASASTIASCWSHWVRGHAVAVARPVEVAVVEVGEAGPFARRRDGSGDPLPDAVGADELRAAVRRDRQPAPAELALVDHRHRRAVRRSPVNAVACGCHSLGSTCLSHASALSSRSVPGIREVKPTSPCAPGRQGGAERGQAGRGRRRDAGGAGRLATEQRGEVRRRLGVPLQQPRPEAVDQEHDVRRGFRQHQTSGAARRAGA